MPGRVDLPAPFCCRECSIDREQQASGTGFGSSSLPASCRPAVGGADVAWQVVGPPRAEHVTCYTPECTECPRLNRPRDAKPVRERAQCVHTGFLVSATNS